MKFWSFILIFISASALNLKEDLNKRINITANEISPYDNPSETYRLNLYYKNNNIILFESYYSLAFCQPEIILEEKQTLGESLSGDRKANTLYQIELGSKKKTKENLFLSIDEKIKKYKKYEEKHNFNKIFIKKINSS